LLTAHPDRSRGVRFQLLVQGGEESRIGGGPGLDPELAAQEPGELLAGPETSWLSFEALDARLSTASDQEFHQLW
jgi:hypothetical protein